MYVISLGLVHVTHSCKTRQDLKFLIRVLFFQTDSWYFCVYNKAEVLKSCYCSVQLIWDTACCLIGQTSLICCFSEPLAKLKHLNFIWQMRWTVLVLNWWPEQLSDLWLMQENRNKISAVLRQRGMLYLDYWVFTDGQVREKWR